MTRDWTQEYFGITENTPVSDTESDLRRKLDIAVKALEKLQRRDCVDCKCGENCSLREYSKKGKGCSTCVSGLAEETLAKIKEIK